MNQLAEGNLHPAPGFPAHVRYRAVILELSLFPVSVNYVTNGSSSYPRFYAKNTEGGRYGYGNLLVLYHSSSHHICDQYFIPLQLTSHRFIT
jgi:hypothetical protein